MTGSGIFNMHQVNKARGISLDSAISPNLNPPPRADSIADDIWDIFVVLYDKNPNLAKLYFKASVADQVVL